MLFNFAFLTVPVFYMLLVVGVAALVPRAKYAAATFNHRQNDAATEPASPTTWERWCVLVPGICVLLSVAWLRSPYAAVALTVVYIVAFALMIRWLRDKPKAS